MPNAILGGTQTQSGTTSNNGRNVRPALQPFSRFYLEDANFSQQQGENFGVKNADKFRTTAKVTFSGSKKIFAICSGTVLVQPNDGDINKVNVILRPFKQPINEISIKYFIYRGLDKADFIAANGIVAGSETSGSGFVKYIWGEYNRFYSLENSTLPDPQFSAAFIGFPTAGSAQIPTDLIDNYFFKKSQYTNNGAIETAETAFELPLVQRGIHLGNANGSVGLDIVLNDGDYYLENDPNPFRFDLAYARTPDHELSTALGNTDFQKKLIKDISSRFIDAAAFFGIHAGGNGKLIIDENNTVLTAKEDIYNHLNGFFTKNTVYLYIQSNRQRVYNFYENYAYSDTNANNIKIGDALGNVTETTFGQDRWAVHSLDNALQLEIRLTTDNYSEAALYVKTGFITSEHANNFVRGKNLLETPSNDPNAIVDTGYTLPLTFTIEEAQGNAVATFIQLIYEGKQLSITDSAPPFPNGTGTPPPPVQVFLKDIDDVFGLLKAKSLMMPNDSMELPAVTEHNLQLINFPNTQQDSDMGMVKTKRVNDALQTTGAQYLKRVTYETLLDGITRNIGISRQTASASIDNATGSTTRYETEKRNNFYQPESPYFLKTELFTDSTLTITGLGLYVTDGSIPTKKILGITETENLQFLDLITGENLVNPKFFFQNLLGSENSQFVSVENIAYKIYSLKLVAENPLGELHLYHPPQEVRVYTKDGFVFASHGYAEYVPELNQTQTNVESLKVITL